LPQRNGLLQDGIAAPPLVFSHGRGLRDFRRKTSGAETPTRRCPIESMGDGDF